MRDEREVREAMSDVLAALPEQERGILRLRFGLDDGQPRTLAQVAQMLGLTTGQIQKLEADALQLLRERTEP